MCVIYFAFGICPNHPLILIANRDEFYERPSLAAAYWDDHPYIYGGRDLVGGGTWLGVTENGRFAAVTNYRDPAMPKGTLSRGQLVADFLRSNEAPEYYIRNVKKAGAAYSGFNLLVGEISRTRNQLLYFSNRGQDVRDLQPGIYGLSNHLLDTPWPKVEKGKARFAALINDSDADNERFFQILADETLADDNDLPSTGIPFDVEKAISAIFIKTPGYGTRCSTVLAFDRELNWDLEERVFD